MRALIIQHDHVSPPGPVAERLAELGIETVLHPVVPKHLFDAPGITTEFPDPAGFGLIIPMGSPWSVYDTELIGPWISQELELLRQADDQGVPVLGICFGGQALAMAHGGDVRASEHPEIGFVRIQSDDPELIPPGPWFQWHSDCWELPPGAEEIARNAAASQAFVLRRNLAVQFHPELTSHMLSLWLDNGGAEIARGRGIDVEDMHARAVAEDAAAEQRAHALVDTFIDRFCEAPARGQ